MPSLFLSEVNMEKLQGMNALRLSHQVVKSQIQEGSLCIDATAGNGGDTVFLAKLIGPSGKLHAFDIQEQAVNSTLKRLQEENLANRCKVHLMGHEHMREFAESASVDCIMFNFGWLPGGDHHVGTRAETSIEALKQALNLIKPGGIISLCLYYGGLSGFEERDALLAFFQEIDSGEYTVLLHDFLNRSGCPPLFVLIERHVEEKKGRTI